jgi:uncharacterized protein (UPF0335 family)
MSETQEQIQPSDVTTSKLKRFIEQIEHAEQEKLEVMEHIRDIYAAAKSEGFEPRIMRKIVGMRKRRREEVEEEEMLLETYKRALGME